VLEVVVVEVVMDLDVQTVVEVVVEEVMDVMVEFVFVVMTVVLAFLLVMTVVEVELMSQAKKSANSSALLQNCLRAKESDPLLLLCVR
jgi:hypothetical protein